MKERAVIIEKLENDQFQDQGVLEMAQSLMIFEFRERQGQLLV